MSIEEVPAFTTEDLSAEDYAQPSHLILMSNLPRFGHKSNFAKLLSSNQDEQVDYVMGILAAAFFILSLFIFWGAAIMSCKCLGRRRIGFLSGRMHLQPDKKGRFRPPLYLWKLRYTFMFLGCFIIACALMLAMPATKSVLKVSKSSQKIHREIKDLTDQGLLIVADLSRVKKNVDALDVRSILQVEKLCPDYKTFLSTDESLNATLQLIQNEFDDVHNMLEGFDFTSLRNSIDFVNTGTDHIETAARVVQENDWLVKMYVLVLNVMVVFMLLAASEILDKEARINPALQMMVNVFIFPVFVSCVVIAVISAVLLAVVGTANSDFCAGGPEVTVSNILMERGLIQGSMVYDTFEYYQSGCRTTDPMALFYKYEDRLHSGIASASKFLDQSNEIGMEEMNKICGANVRPLVEVISVLRDNLGILLSALRSTFDATSCSRVSPIYQQTFNANACEESASGISLMFMVTFTIATIGMVMIMLRSAMHPYRSVKRNPYLDQDEKISEYDEYKSYVSYTSEFVNMLKKKDYDDSSEPTATWSGSIDSRSEEEKHLSLTTPAWDNHVTRPNFFQSSTGSNNGEDGHVVKTPRFSIMPSSLMLSPCDRGTRRNFFNLGSPLSLKSYNMSVSSRGRSDAHVDEEQPLSPETSSIGWDNDWESKVDRCLAGSSPLSLGSNEGRLMLSPVPGEINNKEHPSSPETPAMSSNYNNLKKKASASTPSSAISSASIPSIQSNDFNDIDGTTQPDSSNNLAGSLPAAIGFFGALLGSSPAANSNPNKMNADLWHNGEIVDAVPSISWDENTLSTVNSPNALNEKVESTSEYTSKTNNDDELALSPESSRKDSSSSQGSTIRTRSTPQLKAEFIPNDQGELKQLTPEARDDQEAVSVERSTTKRFNVMRFGTPDFLSPLRGGAAKDYKKIE